MSDSTKRHLIGLFAVVFCSIALYFYISPPEHPFLVNLHAASARVGIFCIALWLAWKELLRLPPWIFKLIPILVVLLAWKPKLFLLAIPIVLAILILRPKNRKK
jgi:hypothetical protein